MKKLTLVLKDLVKLLALGNKAAQCLLSALFKLHYICGLQPEIIESEEKDK